MDHGVDPSASWALTRRPALRSVRAEAGRSRRDAVPLESHAELGTRPDRDALAVLRAQDATRVAALVPIRYGRMVASPFTYLRGAAAVMAADLALAPQTELTVQLCGDAHLANVGAFAAPDRRLVVDVNDFDETLQGPFEWDVKRLAASVVAAAADNGCSPEQSREAALAAVRSYRGTMHAAAALDPVDLWYFRLEYDELVALVRDKGGSLKGDKKRQRQAKATAARKDRLGALAKLTAIVDGRRVIVARPPRVIRLPEEQLHSEMARVVRFFEEYAASLPLDRRRLLQRFSLSDLAVKVVGVGSVGTRCLIALMESGDGEPLFLQLKEAGASVLEAHLAPSPFTHAGQRVVEGQRLVQSASDPFLGWARYQPETGPTVDFYLRQLWDGKLSATIEGMSLEQLSRYGRVCGAVLARAHARSGDAAMIAGYLGDSDAFEQAAASFASTYADRTAADHRQLVEAIESGAVEADLEG